jgi:hypothetical protein
MKLFFSYSHADEPLRDELEKHLAMLKRQGVIEAWHDRRILAGDPIDPRIDAELEAAEIVLLLVSADFLASEYCYDREMGRALERHTAGEARVIPVILRPCDWHHAPFGDLLSTPKDGKPIVKWPSQDEAFLDVVRAIRAAATAMGSTTITASAPDTTSTAGRTGSTGRPATEDAPPQRPRSSNLRVRRAFTDHDRDVFLDEAYEFVANYFEGSLQELRARNPGLEVRYRRVGAHHFEAAIYRDGKSVSQCRIWLGRGGFPTGIAYSSSLRGSDNGFNEALSVGSDDHKLFLTPFGMAMRSRGEADGELTQEGGAEFLWSMFMEPLQR